jgi:hypothetical protein
LNGLPGICGRIMPARNGHQLLITRPADGCLP